MEANGNCYEVHAVTIIDAGPLENCSLLCHGTVYHPAVGWHGHCWIEINEGTVLDIANDRQTVMPRERYYSIGKVKDVKRYNPAQVRELLLEHENYGPWSEDETV